MLSDVHSYFCMFVYSISNLLSDSLFSIPIYIHTISYKLQGNDDAAVERMKKKFKQTSVLATQHGENKAAVFDSNFIKRVASSKGNRGDKEKI